MTCARAPMCPPDGCQAEDCCVDRPQETALVLIGRARESIRQEFYREADAELEQASRLLRESEAA